MAVEFSRRSFTVYDYARMRETGILTEADRVELIDGEIRNMSPIGPAHAAIVNKIVKVMTTQVQDSAIISPQNPIRLSDYTEPQPDIAVLAYRDDFYAAAHPTADDVLLVIEVSDSTFSYDREEKIPRYAAAGIPEAWVVNLNAYVVEQYTTPVQGQYTRMHKVLLGETLVSPTVGTIQLDTGRIFG